jgi:hypothetical protein
MYYGYSRRPVIKTCFTNTVTDKDLLVLTFVLYIMHTFLIKKFLELKKQQFKNKLQTGWDYEDRIMYGFHTKTKYDEKLISFLNENPCIFVSGQLSTSDCTLYI